MAYGGKYESTAWCSVSNWIPSHGNIAQEARRNAFQPGTGAWKSCALIAGRNHAPACRTHAAKIRGVGFFIVLPYVKTAFQGVNLGANASAWQIGLPQSHSFNTSGHQRSLASVVFSLNMLPGPNGILKPNLVLGNKIHELCGWGRRSWYSQARRRFIDLFNVQGPYYLHVSATIRRKCL
jgi:hypothetical protein